MKQEQIESLEKKIHEEYNNIAGIVVLKNGQLMYQNYFNDCHMNSRIHVYSVSKSILSIVIGIAIDKGYIQSVNQKVLDFFPEYTVKKTEKTIQRITIKDLLTMCAPYKHKETPISYIKYFMSKDWLTFCLNDLGGKKQVGEFRYTPLIGSDILSGILLKATGQSVLDFATKHLFLPLQITVEKSIVLKNAKEQKGFNKATNMSGWVVDPKGLHAGGWGLTLSAGDMAKIGQLFLNHGVWDNKQIVSSSWLEASTREHSRWKEMDLPYGYLWWIIDDKQKACAAMGDGGNVIYFNVEKNIVISIASLFDSKAKDRLAFIKEEIEPIFETV